MPRLHLHTGQPGAAAASPYASDNVRRGAWHYLLGRAMSGLAGFASVLLLVRYMDIAAYAGYAALLGLCVLVGMVSGLGMERALARYIPEGRLREPVGALAGLIWFAAAVRAAIAALLTLAIHISWPLLRDGFAGFGGLDFPPALALLLVGSAMFQLLSSVLQALVQQKALTRVMLVQWTLRLAAIVTLVLFERAVTMAQALWVLALPDALGALALAWLVRRHLRELQLARRQRVVPAGAAWPPWRRAIRMALDNYGYNLVAALPQGAAMIVVAAAFLGAPLVAAYGFYISLVDRLKQYLPLQFMLNLVEPVLIAGYLHDRDFERLCRRAQLLYKANLLLLLPVLAWVAVVSGDLSALLTGGKFHQHGWLLAVLLLQLMLGSHATILQIVINGTGASAALLHSGCAALAAMAIAIGVTVLCAQPHYLLATPLLYEAVNNAVAIARLRQQGFRYRTQWPMHARLVLLTPAAAVLAGWAGAQFATPLPRIAAAGAVALAVCCAGVALTGVVRAADLAALRQLLRPAPHAQATVEAR